MKHPVLKLAVLADRLDDRGDRIQARQEERAKKRGNAGGNDADQLSRQA